MAGCCKFLLLVIAACSVTASRVRLKNNAYTGLVVSVDRDADVSRCVEIVANIKELLNAASSFLYAATNQRASFGDATILLPRSWPRHCGSQSQMPPDATTESRRTADIRVTAGAHPLHGDAPWTHQWGLCGRPGQFIQMGQRFLAPAARHVREDRARALVHEWAKFRWGVFDERGFAGDPLYPDFYRSHPVNWTHSGCSNKPVAGANVPLGCNVASGQCTFVPFMNSSNNAVTSSLMYQPHLPRVRNFCDSSSHVAAAPTKHNLLCGGRSVWEVMQHHLDFHNGNNAPSSNATVRAVAVRLVRAAEDRIMFLLESSAVMRQQDRWDLVVSSVRKFISWDATSGSLLGISHFGSSFHTDRNMTRVPQLLQGRLELANLPPVADHVPEQQKNWPAAIDGAVRALGNSAPGATIVMVTGGSRTESVHRPSAVDVEYMIAALRQKQTRLVVIFYPYATAGLELVAAASGGETLLVEDASVGSHAGVGVFASLTDAFVHVQRQYSSDQLSSVLVERRRFAGDGRRARGSFQLDSSLGANTTLMVMYQRRAEIGYVKLRAPGGLMMPVYMHPDSTNHLQYARISSTTGRWEYEIDNLAPTHSSIYVQVVSSPVSTSAGTVSVKMWTNAAATGDATIGAASARGLLNATKTPLIIYASVMHGQDPIVDAEVYAVVIRGDGSRVRVQLLDNGLGVPDLTYGDGVYSRYFTSYGRPANVGSGNTLRLSVEVGGTRSRRLLAVSQSPSTDVRQRMVGVGGRSWSVPASPCCGSRIPTSVRSVRVSDLRRTASGGDVRLYDVPAAGRDIYPPSRVTDLRADVNATLRTVAFKWTAVGDDFDMAHTKVARYEVRYSRNRQLLVANFSRATSVPHWTQPRVAGQPSSAVIDFNMFDTLLYFGMRGIDDAGNRAPVSNIVAVVVSPPPVSTTTQSPSTVNPQPSGALLDRNTLLIILLCVAVALVFIVCMAVYFFVCFRRRRRDDIKIEKQTMTTSAGDALPYDRSRLATPLKHPALSGGYDNSLAKSGPAAISDGRTPVMWSASQILETQGDVAYGVDASGYGYRTSTHDVNSYHHHQQQHGGRYPAGASVAGGVLCNSYQTPYAEDMPAGTSGYVDDGRSLASSPPSDSAASLSRTAAAGPSALQHCPATAGGGGYCWHSDKDALVQSAARPDSRLASRAAPPTRPKPRVSPHLDCTVSSTGSDKKRRNVTQV